MRVTLKAGTVLLMLAVAPAGIAVTQLTVFGVSTPCNFPVSTPYCETGAAKASIEGIKMVGGIGIEPMTPPV